MEYASVIIVAVLGLLGNVIASALNSNKQTAVMQAEIKGSNALIDQKIGEVKADIATLSSRVDKHNNLVERMATVESSAKSAHKRMDDAGLGRASQ